MPADHNAANEFDSHYGDLRKYELVPTFINDDPSTTDLRLAKFFWLLVDICSRGTPQHAAYARSLPIEVPRWVISTALGVGSGIARELVDVFYGPYEGRLNLIKLNGKNNKRVEILQPTEQEVDYLLEWRREEETKAALRLHQCDRLNGHGPTDSGQRIKRELAQSLPDVVNMMQDIAAEFSAGNLSPLDRRIKAERFWAAEVHVRDQLFEVVGMTCQQVSNRRVRNKLRLVGSVERVVLECALDTVRELKSLVDAVLSICDDNRKTSDRVVDTVSTCIDREKQHLLTVLRAQGDDE